MVVMAATWRDWGITRTCGGRGVPGGGRGKALSELKLNPLCSNHLLASILFFNICFTFIFIFIFIFILFYFILYLYLYLYLYLFYFLLY